MLRLLCTLCWPAMPMLVPALPGITPPAASSPPALQLYDGSREDFYKKRASRGRAGGRQQQRLSCLVAGSLAVQVALPCVAGLTDAPMSSLLHCARRSSATLSACCRSCGSRSCTPACVLPGWCCCAALLPAWRPQRGRIAGSLKPVARPLLLPRRTSPCWGCLKTATPRTRWARCARCACCACCALPPPAVLTLTLCFSPSLADCS